MMIYFRKNYQIMKNNRFKSLLFYFYIFYTGALIPIWAQSHFTINLGGLNWVGKWVQLLFISK